MEFGFSEIVSLGALIISGIACLAAVDAARSARKALRRANLIPEVILEKDAPWPGWHMITINMLNPGPATTVITGIETPRRWKVWQPRAQFIVNSELPREEHKTVQQNTWLGQTHERTTRALTAAPPSDQGMHTLTDLNLQVPRSGAKPLRLVLAIPASSPLPPHLVLIGHWADQRNSPRMTKVYI